MTIKNIMQLQKIQFLVYKFSKETEMICMGANILPIRRRGAKWELAQADSSWQKWESSQADSSCKVSVV
jgi:hypothetical protein